LLLVLLETLPATPELWAPTKKKNYELYRSLIDKFVGRYVDEEDLLSMKEDFDSQLWN
jgi:hypothetical protein